MWRGAAASTRPGASGLGPSKKLLKASHSSPRCPSRSSNGGDDQDGATGGGTVRDHGKDTAALRRFNGDLFDWKITEGAKGSGFGVVHATEHGISGIGPDHTGGHGRVTIYVEVDDPAACLEKAERLGAKTVVAPPRSDGAQPITMYSVRN